MGEPDADPPPKKTSKRMPRPRKPRKHREGAGEDREFLETVWGPPPFDAEDEEPEAAEDETQAPSAKAPRDAERKRPRFELVPTFEAEPLEKDDPKSLEWLLSLVGDALGRQAATGERTEPDTAEPEADESEPDAGEAVSGAAPDAEAAAKEAEGTTGVADDAAGLEETGEPPADGAVESTREPAAARAGARRTGQGRRPGGRTFVVPSSDPDVDSEAPIPVVVFGEGREGRWRPTELQKRIAAGLAIILGGWLAYQSLLSPGAPEPPPTNAAPPPPGLQAAAPPPAEFVDLADAYLTRLQTYRERLVDFRLERVDCAGLADHFGAVAAAHASLAKFVAGRPGLADRFETLTGEFIATRQRFDATGCEPPPEPGPGTAPIAGTGGPGTPSDGSGGS